MVGRSGDGRAQHRLQVRALPALWRAGGGTDGDWRLFNTGTTAPSERAAMVTVDEVATMAVCVHWSGAGLEPVDLMVICRVSVATRRSGYKHLLVNCVLLVAWVGCCGRDVAQSGLSPRRWNGHGHDRDQTHFEHHQPDQQPRTRSHQVILSVVATGNRPDIKKIPQGFHLLSRHAEV